MITREKLKYVASLRQKKYRDLHQVFVVEGEKWVCEMLGSHYEVVEVFAVNDWVPLQMPAVPVIRVAAGELARMSGMTTPNKVLALVRQPRQPAVSEVSPQETVLVLDRISDPGNLGTILRIADWFGIQLVICSPDCCELYNPKVVQASMGSLTRVQVQSADLAAFLKKNNGKTPVYGALLDGEDLRGVEQGGGGMIIIGNESHGISEQLRSYVTSPVRIPSLGHAESLNAAVAAGILCYHLKACR